MGSGQNFLNRVQLGAVEETMNPAFCRFVLAGLLCCVGVSCTTAYDAYGYPQQVVDPAAAVVGAAAVGLLAYGLANTGDHHHRGSHYRYYDRYDGHRGGSYYRPYYGRHGGHRHY